MKIIRDFEGFVNGKGLKKAVATLFFNPCFHSICLYRLSHACYQIHLGILGKIIWYINRLLFHVDIDYKADLAGGFVLIHGLGTVIGGSVRSEGRMIIYQGVTIGGNNGKTRNLENGKTLYQPLLKDNVTIYTNACVFGPVIINENTIIKAGSMITHDI